jgi:hypothetical protein
VNRKSCGKFTSTLVAPLIRNPILKVLSSIQTHRVQALLMGGQACVFYGAAEFSRDTDLAIGCLSRKNLKPCGTLAYHAADYHDLTPKTTPTRKFIAGTMPEEYDTFPRAHRPIGKHTDSSSVEVSAASFFTPCLVIPCLTAHR